MSEIQEARENQYFVGWDVGGWNCDKNPNSRDAIAVLQETSGSLVVKGSVFRGNIRDSINKHSSLHEIVNGACKTAIQANDEIVVAIDTPLGFPKAFQDLVHSLIPVKEVPSNYSHNPYLYRQTERWLFENGYAPLSAIKDMIGSQSTKGLHLLAKLGLKSVECGVWNVGTVTAIEAYPSPSKGSQFLSNVYANLGKTFVTDDRVDAVFCALIAWLFATNRSMLSEPVDCPPDGEGWIWVPRDVMGKA